ncbi:hypothetical protein [Sphingosinicella sp. LY1275]|uniref:hypothetical protein n=1 Tax=Sphingosinicella sp. LY1275 TaxID=3095379 RepID=UPI002ADED42E|nr:hypothetical protein [Sphingosinicella sp. LY1275]MEA1015572.1 hypothetical protein [Sphingosinicella sp. LY1275]
MTALLLIAQSVAAAAQAPPSAAATVADPCQPQASCPNEARAYVRVAPQTAAAQRAARGDPPPAGEDGARTGDDVPSDDVQSPDDGQRPDSDGTGEGNGGLDILAILLATAGVVGGALLIDQLTGDKWSSAKDLEKDGPKFPRKQAVGRYQVQGFAVAGWPVVVDVESLPETETWLEVAYKGDRSDQLVRIPIPGDGRRETVVNLPAPADSFADVRVARYSIHSYLRDAQGTAVYQPLKVYGFGAGPRAVGSTLLKITSFTPDLATRPDEVRYGLQALRLFDRSVVEVLRLPKPGGRKLERVSTVRFQPLQQGNYPGDWRTMQGRPKPQSGIYHLQARGWLVGARNDERDWTGAIAPNLVRIP